MTLLNDSLKVELFSDLERLWIKDNITSPIVVTGLIDWEGRSKRFNKVFPTFIEQVDGNWSFYLFGLNTKDYIHNKLTHQYESKYSGQRKALILNLHRRNFEFINNDLDILENLARWEYSHS